MRGISITWWVHLHEAQKMIYPIISDREFKSELFTGTQAMRYGSKWTNPEGAAWGKGLFM